LRGILTLALQYQSQFPGFLRLSESHLNWGGLLCLGIYCKSKFEASCAGVTLIGGTLVPQYSVQIQGFLCRSDAKSGVLCFCIIWCKSKASRAGATLTRGPLAPRYQVLLQGGGFLCRSDAHWNAPLRLAGIYNCKVELQASSAGLALICNHGGLLRLSIYCQVEASCAGVSIVACSSRAQASCTWSRVTLRGWTLAPRRYLL
jgi:hypothetical protein